MKRLFLLISLTIVIYSVQTYGKKMQHDANSDIMQIVNKFTAAIIEKNESEFINLFYEKSIPWLGVHGYKRQSKVTSDIAIDKGSHLTFIAWVRAQPEIIEEKFSNIRIISDNDIASVYFDYSFHIGEHKSNWGEESWQLVKTSEGWKISAVTYSVNLIPIDDQ